ncbi:MAG: flagellar basal body P-ring formation protein FlgA [Phycisphaerales bacterium]|nr:flagellar basal body P-ring formation protein FlgA [Phycisphaerales bacterium]
MEVVMRYGRPMGRRGTVQMLVWLTILAWATQTLFHQWGFGAEAPATPEQMSPEQFVPSIGRPGAGGTLELRTEASVYGPEVRLKQVCRWSEADGAMFGPIADLILARLSDNSPFRSLSVQDVKNTLRDAGVNLGVIRFSGATACTVSRADARYDEGEALQQWIDAQRGSNSTPKAPQTPQSQQIQQEQPPTTMPTTPVTPAVAAPVVKPESDRPYRSLQQILVTDLAQRLGVSADSLQVDFNPRDEKVLALIEPQFRFAVTPRRSAGLGAQEWDVVIVSGDQSQKATINANAKAWQEQVVVSKPLAYKQLIRDEDVVDRRALVERLDDSPLLARSQVVGQQAAMEMKPGTVMTARMVDPVPLARTGQLVTVVVSQGNVTIRTVARAMEGGTYGQSIKVRNEVTRDVFDVILTGPQMGRMSAGGMGVASVGG